MCRLAWQLLGMLGNVLSMLAMSSASSTCFLQGPRSPISKINLPTCCLISCEAKGVMYHQVSIISISNDYAFYYQTKTSISIQYIQELNLKSQIQSLKILPIDKIKFSFRIEFNALIYVLCQQNKKEQNLDPIPLIYVQQMVTTLATCNRMTCDMLQPLI